MTLNKQVDISRFRHLYPFKSHYMNINGLQYHYIDEGAGDPVVMIHGNPTWSFYFRKLVNELSGQFRTIVPDHIGCGLSEKPDSKRYGFRLKDRIDDIEYFIDKLNLKKITLILHDWGGMIGMGYAVKHHKNICKIIIMNTAAFLPPKEKKIPWRLWIIRNLKPFAVIGVQGFNLFSVAALYMASKKGLDRDVKCGLTAPYNCWKNRIATLKFVQDIPVKKNDPSYDIVENVDKNLYKLKDIPMLICWGKHDFVFDMSYLEMWQKRFPNAQINTISHAGHYVLEDAPEKTAMLVKVFLTQNLKPKT